MAKKKGDEAKEAAPPKKNTTTTKVDAELLRQAKTVASFRDMDLYDYLDGILREAVARDYRGIVRPGAGSEGGA